MDPGVEHPVLRPGPTLPRWPRSCRRRYPPSGTTPHDHHRRGSYSTRPKTTTARLRPSKPKANASWAWWPCGEVNGSSTSDAATGRWPYEWPAPHPGW